MSTLAIDAASVPVHTLHVLTVDNLTLTVAPPTRAASMEIVVERDASLVLRAPASVTDAAARAFVQAKRSWIYRRLAEKDALIGPPVTKAMVNGEGFAYLGRSYRLTLGPAAIGPVRLDHGRFIIPETTASSEGRRRDATLVHRNRSTMAPTPHHTMGCSSRRHRRHC